MGVTLTKIIQLNELKHFTDACQSFCFFNFAITETEFNVLSDGQIGEEAVTLENHSHISLMGWCSCDVTMRQRNNTGIGNFKTCGDA